jgi:hypothetical protein
VHVYRVQGADPDYLMLFEIVQPDNLRRYGLARAGSLGGPWRLETDPYASGAQLRWPPGTPGWTDSGQAFRQALLAYDWDHGPLDRVLETADTPDTLSLWHILQRVPAGDRSKVAQRIEKLAPTVLVSDPIKKSLDGPDLLRLRQALSGIW